MVTVQFFKTSKVDNAGRMGNFASETEQESYFSGLTKLTVNGARLNNLGEPIEVQKPWTTMLGYSYGRFQVNNVWIYFSVRDIDPINDTKTRILYDIDCWETARFQYGASLGRGKVSRSGRNLSTANPRPFTPIYVRTSTVQEFKETRRNTDFVGFAFVRDSENNINYIYQSGSMSANADLGDFLDGSWLSKLGITNLNDVMGAWLSPWGTADTSGWEPTGPTSIQGFRIDASKANNVTMYRTFSLSDGGPYGNQDEVIGVTDMRDNVIWSCDMSSDAENASFFEGKLNISPSSCNWRCTFNGSPEFTFTIPCEPVYIFGDAFTEYNVRQRAYDMELRSINNDQQLVQGLTNVVSAGIGGGVAGASAGPIGAIGGAVVGTVGQLAGTIASYMLQPGFDARTQRATDAYYKRQADTLNLTGDGLLSIINGDTGVKMVKMETDPATVSQYNAAISTAGYFYSDLESEDMEDFVVDGPLTASVEVLGSIPDTWKAQIQARIAQGVIFV